MIDDNELPFPSQAEIDMFEAERAYNKARREQEAVRVLAQLVDGHSGHQIWAERYEDVLSDVFELQERITRQVVSTMVPEIEAEEIRLAASADLDRLSGLDPPQNGGGVMLEFADARGLHRVTMR